MKEGLYNRPLADIEEIGGLVMEWDPSGQKRVELLQYFPPFQTSATTGTTSLWAGSVANESSSEKSAQ